jgi:hypothetical protein
MAPARREAKFERDFERTDFGRSPREPGTFAVVPRPKLERTSILMDPALVAKLVEKAARRGLPGYQTMLKMIVAEHIDEY